MSELEMLKKLVTVLTRQRNFAFDNLAQMEAERLMERDAAAKSVQDVEATLKKKRDAA
jgi:hypothetical protein